MKKILSMILASVMVLSLLAACGSKPQDPPAQDNPPKQEDNTPANGNKANSKGNR